MGGLDAELGLPPNSAPLALYCRKPGVLREAPVAASLVPEGRGPLSARAEGTRERGLLTPAEAAQAAVAVLEQPLITVLLSSGLGVPVLLLLGRGLRCCHPLLIQLLLSSLALVLLPFFTILSTRQGTRELT